MIELVFTKDYATYKAKDKASFKPNLASLILKQGVAKVVKQKKETTKK